MKVAIIFFILGLCEGMIVADWLKVRFERPNGLRQAQNHSQRKLHPKTAKAERAVAALK